MISAVERRHEHARIPCAIPVALTDAERARAFLAAAVDLSAGGLSLRAETPPAIGARLECTFEPVPGGTRVSGQGEVVWARHTDEGGGEFGLRFTHIDPDSRAVLTELIATRVAHGDSQPPPPPAPAAETVDGTITTRLARATGYEVVFEQALDALALGRSVVAHAEQPLGHGNIHKVDLRMDRGTPTLALTVRFNQPQQEYGEFDLGAQAPGEVHDSEPPEPTTHERPRPNATLAGIGAIDRGYAHRYTGEDEDTVPDLFAPSDPVDNDEQLPMTGDTLRLPVALLSHPAAHNLIALRSTMPGLPAAAETTAELAPADAAGLVRATAAATQAEGLAQANEAADRAVVDTAAADDSALLHAEALPATHRAQAPAVATQLGLFSRSGLPLAQSIHEAETTPGTEPTPSATAGETDYVTPSDFEEHPEGDSHVDAHAAIALGDAVHDGSDAGLAVEPPLALRLAGDADAEAAASESTAASRSDEAWEPDEVTDEARKSALVRFLRILAAIVNTLQSGYEWVEGGVRRTTNQLVPSAGRRLVRSGPSTLRVFGARPRRTTGVPAHARDAGVRKPWRVVVGVLSLIGSGVLAVYAFAPGGPEAELALHRELLADDSDVQSAAAATAETEPPPGGEAAETAQSAAARLSQPAIARAAKGSAAGPSQLAAITIAAKRPGGARAATQNAAPTNLVEPAPATGDKGTATRAFGHRQVPNPLRFTLRTKEPVQSMYGSSDGRGFTIVMPGHVAKDKAKPLEKLHNAVERAAIQPRGDNTELIIRFAEGKHPAFRVSAKDTAELEILLAR